MTRIAYVAALVASATFTCTGATAQSLPAGELDMLKPADQLILPNASPRIERTYAKGVAILATPIMWRSGATLAEDVTITAGTESRALKRGAVLQGALLTDKTRVQRINAYCTPRIAAERKADKGVAGVLLGGGSLWRGLIKSATDGQFCLIDADRDGIAEASVLINAGPPAARFAVRIANVRLTPQTMLPISSGDEVRIVLTGVSTKNKDATFRLDIVQQGETRVFDTAGPTRRITKVDVKNGLPARDTIYGAPFDIIGIDGAAQTVSIRWPQDVDTVTPIIVDDGLRVVVRYGYY
jgi:hypothetical protein